VDFGIGENDDMARRRCGRCEAEVDKIENAATRTTASSLQGRGGGVMLREFGVKLDR